MRAIHMLAPLAFAVLAACATPRFPPPLPDPPSLPPQPRPPLPPRVLERPPVDVLRPDELGRRRPRPETLAQVLARRFAYLHEPGGVTPTDGAPIQEVRLAEVVALSGPSAEDVRTLYSNAAETVPVRVNGVLMSPGNSRVLIWSTSTPLQALDVDFEVHGAGVATPPTRFNEHTLAPMIRRATCPSQEFLAFLVGYASQGATPEDLAALDFAIQVEGVPGANVPAPQEIAWVDETTLFLRWRFDVRATSGQEFQETFDLVLADVHTATPRLASCTRPATIPAPTSSHALTARPALSLNGAPLTWPDPPSPRPAQAVTGNLRLR